MTDKNDFPVKEGLYFNMTDDEYHAIPALSASGLKMLKNNPSKFWWWSWMNPEKEQGDTDAKVIGKAFHKRILEGKEAFYSEYAREYTNDSDDLIRTGNDIKAILREEKEKDDTVRISFSSVDEGYKMLLAIDMKYRDKIYAYLLADYQTEHAGKIFLSNWVVDRIELAAKVIENHPYLKAAFIGGYSEVSCVWYDERYNEWFKCRYDYLKVSTINDLKTFTRMSNKHIERYLPDVIAKYSYNIQATLYIYSMEYAKRFAGEGKVFGDVDEAWLKAFATRPCDQFRFVFQQKEEIPNAYEVIFSKEHGMYDSCMAMISTGVDNYKKMVKDFGTELWPEIIPPLVLTDDAYPIWAYE